MAHREAAMLILREGPKRVQQWTLDQDEMTIGRWQDCDIVLDDRQVSRQHAVIVRDASGYLLRDLQSKNGTFLNGEAVQGERRLQDGDEIQIALRFCLGFVDAGATVPLYFERPPEVGLHLDKEARAVIVDGKAIAPPLSPAQFRLLELLVDNRDRVVSRDEVIRAVWPEAAGEGVTEQAIDALVRRLRERLGEVDPRGQYVATVRGHGFRLTSDRS